MSDLLAKLLGIERFSLADPDVRFEFAHAPPAWAWVFILGAVVGFALWAYWRLSVASRARAALSVLRALLLLLIVVLICGPQFTRQTSRTEKDWVIVLADRSMSMQVRDAPGRRTRDEQLSGAIAQSWPVWSQLRQERNVLFMGFDAGAYELRTTGGDAGAPLGIALGEASGARTSLSRAIEQALRRVAGRPVAGIVVLSDGRSTEPASKGLVRQLESRRIPVLAVPLGSESGVIDLAVARVEAPSAAFVDDVVPVVVTIEARGGGRWPEGVLELVDADSGAVLDTRELPAGDVPESGARLTLTNRPKSPGTVRWSVRLALRDEDLSRENDQAQLQLELVGRPIRVVYFDGYPRWEYRYLKNLLLRERSVRSSSLLLASDKRYIQEGSDVLDVLPRSFDDWAGFDVIVMGDLSPALFGEEQLRAIRRHVAERGAGLLWIAGQGSTPAAWRTTPLGDLLPLAIRASQEGETSGRIGPASWLEPVVMARAPAAERLGVLQLGDDPGEPWPAVLVDHSAGWPILRWAQRVEPAALKPTAEVLAVARTEGDTPREAPLVVTMRYGAGRVVYVGTDEIWRYRYARGEALPERFYVPLLRLLARETLGRSGKAATLEVSPDSALVDQPVQVMVRLLDQTLAERRPGNIGVRVTPPQGPGVDLVLRPEGAGEAGGLATVFTARFQAGEPGEYLLGGADPVLLGLDLQAKLKVGARDEEMRLPQADHAALRALAEGSGGRVIPADRIGEAGTLLPNRSLTVLGTPEVETLWDKWIVWVGLMLLACAEWVGRRVVKLP